MPSSARLEALAGAALAEAVGEVGHVPIPDVGRERFDGDQVQLVELDGVLTVDAGVAGPRRNWTRSRVEQPSVLVVGLIRQGGGDLLDVDGTSAQPA